ncbi:hypothetical protein FH972_023633 [Carpinus fangiana]|uniref:Uncharacterized protein n=1 Tax=Carpinus fangiana TaxID=176857 RepID=A0A5N6KY03_9ROSI|nr:hypothetical protein FH972_023633 [Carpinus fangiana]
MTPRTIITIAACLAGVYAAPATSTSSAAAPLITTASQLASALNGLTQGAPANFASGYASVMKSIRPQAGPTSIADAATQLQALYAKHQNDPFGLAADILLNGVAGPQDIDDLTGFSPVCNSFRNANFIPPSRPIYPKKDPADAPYDLPESTLRAAIYIPPGFTYGRKPPIVLIPGTGVYACETFYSNFVKLVRGSDYADVVYLNIPDALLDDLQTSAEYVAYALNYISSISGNTQVSTISWSAGSVAGQWATKYWPSTRNITKDRINVSADYHGTILAPLICPPGLPCPPSVLQQFYNSRFVQTLRNNGGSSAYTTTTTNTDSLGAKVWSIYDEIVEPQQNPNASASIQDARNVGVLNAQIQDICGLASVAGAPNFGHEAALYNAVTFALGRDALRNNGPANVARSGALAACGNFTAGGLDLADVLATEATIPLAGFRIVTYPRRVVVEPAIKSYALKDAPPA